MNMEMPKKISKNILKSELGPSVQSHAAWYHHMQETQPVRSRPEYQLWEVFRYQDVVHVLSDHATFSIEGNQPEGFPSVLGKSDPPQHRQLRSLVSKAFTPRRIAALTPQLLSIVDELLEMAATSGKMNVTTQLANPLPVRVMACLFGLPPSDQDTGYDRFFRTDY